MAQPRRKYGFRRLIRTGAWLQIVETEYVLELLLELREVFKHVKHFHQTYLEQIAWCPCPQKKRICVLSSKPWQASSKMHSSNVWNSQKTSCTSSFSVEFGRKQEARFRFLEWRGESGQQFYSFIGVGEAAGAALGNCIVRVQSTVTLYCSPGYGSGFLGTLMYVLILVNRSFASLSASLFLPTLGRGYTNHIHCFHRNAIFRGVHKKTVETREVILWHNPLHRISHDIYPNRKRG